MTNSQYPPFPISLDGRLMPLIFQPDVTGFTQDDINSRYKVVRKFAEHPKKVLAMLIQDGYNRSYCGFPTYGNDALAILNGPAFIPTMQPSSLAAGTWFYWPDGVLGYDIVSLKAYQTGKRYKDALVELIDAFDSKEFMGDGERENSLKWCVQEHNSVSVDPNYIEDRFYEYFYNQNQSSFFYFNAHGRFIGKVVKFKNNSNENLEIFYTIWRRKTGEQEKYLPLFPDKPYMLYNQQRVKTDTKTIFFVDDEPEAESLTNNYSMHPEIISGEIVFSACPGGLTNLTDADFTPIAGRKVIVKKNNNIFNYQFIHDLLENCDGLSIELLFDSFEFVNGYYVSAQEILASPERFDLEAPAQVAEKLPGFADIGEELPNANRESIMFLDPIIKSGTINWLFAKAKVGKTLLALSIAYAVGKGDLPVGNWRSTTPRKVLYIDGEMPGDAIQAHIARIMRGYKDNDDVKDRPFKFISLYETDIQFETILDEEWQKKYNPVISDTELVILDNYNTLNDNKLEARPFFNWLKDYAKKGIAFLVLDHTNSDGELQGSKIKLRMADLCIKLEKDEDNTIQVSYEVDRSGVEDKSPAHDLIFSFSDSGFTITPCKPEELCTPDELAPKLKQFAYWLMLSEDKHVSEVVKLTGKPRSTLDNTLNAFKPAEELSPAQKASVRKLSNEEKDQVLKEKDRLKALTEDELEKYRDALEHSGHIKPAKVRSRSLTKPGKKD